MIEKESLILGLHDLGAVQFGEFTLKSGERSPVYVDLRLLISRPATLRRVAHTMAAYTPRLTFDRLAAIPMGGLPIGVALSLTLDQPLIYPRLQAKEHGTGRPIEGIYRSQETVLLIDDVLTRGHSKLESIARLEAAGLQVKDVLVLIDRQMGGGALLASKGYRVHSVLTLREILDVLLQLKRITDEQHRAVTSWLENARPRSPE